MLNSLLSSLYFYLVDCWLHISFLKKWRKAKGVLTGFFSTSIDTGGILITVSILINLLLILQLAIQIAGQISKIIKCDVSKYKISSLVLTNKIPGEKKNILHVLPMENEKHA